MVTIFSVWRIGASTDYQVTLKKGYPVRSCRVRGTETCSDAKIDMDVSLRLTTAALAPSVLVDNSKLILPLADDAVIPVKITNIEDLSYQLFRIQDRQVANSGYLFDSLTGWGVREFRENAELVAEGVLTPPDSRAGQANFNIDVSAIYNDLTGGIYALVMDSPALDLSSWERRQHSGLCAPTSAYRFIAGLVTLLCSCSASATLQSPEGAARCHFSLKSPVIFRRCGRRRSASHSEQLSEWNGWRGTRIPDELFAGWRLLSSKSQGAAIRI